MKFPLCGVFAFDEEGKLAGERIYYDRGSVLRRLDSFAILNPSPGDWKSCSRIRLQWLGPIGASFSSLPENKPWSLA